MRVGGSALPARSGFLGEAPARWLARDAIADGRAQRNLRPGAVEARSGKLSTRPYAGTILVLGGSGFLGRNICKLAVQLGYDVVSVSRRGEPVDPELLLPGVTWHRGNLVKDPDCLAPLLKEHDFVGVIHAVGMLLDNELNSFASGSGSVPDEGSTYDQVTRQTCVNALTALERARPGPALAKAGSGEAVAVTPVPFVFISAAEAGWPADIPFVPPFLRDYLTAKRAVEAAMMDDFGGPRAVVRPCIMRPSLMWTPDRPQALPPVAAFYVANTLGIPGVDRPVRVETVAKAALHAVQDPVVRGVQDAEAMEKLADGCEFASGGRFTG